MRLVGVSGKNLLVIEELPDGTYLYEFRPDGFIGDTWHRTLDDAKDQATFSHGLAHENWHPVPENATDAEVYGRQLFKL